MSNKGLIGSIASSALGGIFGLAGQLATNAANERMAKKANQMEYNMFKESQKYDDVSSQMQRAMAAGLNPMSLAGSSPASGPSAPNLQMATMGNPMSSMPGVATQIGSTIMQHQQQKIQSDEQVMKAISMALSASTEGNGTFEENLSSIGRALGGDFETRLSSAAGDKRTDIVSQILMQKLQGLVKDNTKKGVLLESLPEFVDLYKRVQTSQASLSEAKTGLALSQTQTESVKQDLMKAQEGLFTKQADLVAAQTAHEYKKITKTLFDIELSKASTDEIEERTRHLVAQFQAVKNEANFKADHFEQLRRGVDEYTALVIEKMRAEIDAHNAQVAKSAQDVEASKQNVIISREVADARIKYLQDFIDYQYDALLVRTLFDSAEHISDKIFPDAQNPDSSNNDGGKKTPSYSDIKVASEAAEIADILIGTL